MTVSIEIDDAIKIYKRGTIEVVALRWLSCEFHKGEITVVMGPSGCGKTTLLNVIGGLDRLNSGKILIGDQDIAKLEDEQVEDFRQKKVGFVFQFLNLIPELNAFENIALPQQLAGNFNKSQESHINDLLKMVGLEERKHHRPDELSGGEQQRIGLASALANNPDIILCDEPTGELDSESKLVVMNLLKKVIEDYPEKTIIIVSHDPELKVIADRMFYIRDGKISHTFSKAELREMQKREGLIDSAEGGNLSKKQADKRVLVELREVAHYIGNKIEKIEKNNHAV